MTIQDRLNGRAFMDGLQATDEATTRDAPPPVAAPYQHWAYEVDTPFRPVGELLEAVLGLAPADEEAPTGEEEGLQTVERMETLEATQISEEAEARSYAEDLEGAQPAVFELDQDETGDSLRSEDPASVSAELEALYTAYAPTDVGPLISNIAPGATAFTGPTVQLDHWHCVGVCDPKAGTCTPAKTLSLMTPSAMNPGFIDGTTGAVKVGSVPSSLQGRLSNLIVSKYGTNLTSAARKSGQATAGDRIRVAIVDLSGKRLADPEFAGWGSTIAMQGTSSSKVAILYCVHQLLLDVFRESVVGKHTSKAKLIAALEAGWAAKGLTTMPRVDDLIEITEAPPAVVTVDLSKSAETEVVDAFTNNENSAASRLMLKLTLPYIASVLWQSGLHHATRGGLWLTSSFGCHPSVAKGANTKEHAFLNCANGTKNGRFVWRKDPRAGSATKRQNVTALSLATMFTLLAQGRLGTPRRSTTMLATLRTACRWFWTTRSMATLGITVDPPGKCGIVTVGGVQFVHDVTLVDRPGKRYVAVALTQRVPDPTFHERLIVDLDGLI